LNRQLNQDTGLSAPLLMRGEVFLMDILLFYATIVFYSLAATGYLSHLAWMKKPLWKVSLGLLITGFVLHSACIFTRFYETGYTPATNRFEAQIFFSWLLVAVYLAIQIRHTLPVLGAFLIPPALGLLLLVSFDTKERVLADRLAGLLPSHWLPLHVLFAFLGDALLGVSACFAVMYLMQERQLKRKKIGALYYRLPPLDVIDRLSYRCISIGFPFLTLGILTGSIWLKSVQDGYINWHDGRQTATLLTWFLYAALLHGRLIAGWRGRRVAWLNIVGFLVILVTFLRLSHFMN
jgi:cytochrome c-type biogenesis protein CcsB